MDKQTAEIKMQRMALEIAEQLSDDNSPVLILGIQKSGVVIANYIAECLKPFKPDVIVETITIDKHDPKKIIISNNLNLDDQHIILVDDVTNSGKTLMYALRPLMDFYPKTISILVLVERMYKQFPVKPDFVGLSIATAPKDHIVVDVENNEVKGAYLQ